MKELLNLNVICPGTSRTHEAGSLNQQSIEMTKRLESNITEMLCGACKQSPATRTVAPKTRHVTTKDTRYFCSPLILQESVITFETCTNSQEGRLAGS
jgi:hypothetical protein